MANLSRAEIGRQAQIIGQNAERRVITELEEAGWATEINARLDYAGKTDIRATCPAGRAVPIQVSVKPKSLRTQERLKKMGITPVPVADLDRTGQTAPEFLCGQCPLKTCCRISTDLGSTTIALMQAHKA